MTRDQAGVYQCTADNGIAPPGSVEGQLIVRCESHHVLCLLRWEKKKFIFSTLNIVHVHTVHTHYKWLSRK